MLEKVRSFGCLVAGLAVVAVAVAACVGPRRSVSGVAATAVPVSEPAPDALSFDRLDQSAPDVVIHPATGAALPLSSLRGHPVLLHLWATWCTSCRTELPDLARFAATLSGDDVRFLAVAVADEASRPEVRRFLSGTSLPDLLVPPSAPDVAPYLTWGLPVTYLIDARGTIVARALGARPWSSPSARADVLSRLKGGG